VLVTHDQDEALSVADRVAVLRDGRIAQYAAPQELYNRPADADLARFMGEANLIDGKLTEAGVETVFGLLPVRSGGQDGTGPVTVLLRPEQLAIEATGADRPGGVPGQVTDCGYHGHDAVLRVRAEGDPGLRY
jgi:iron(III) transport system ATP-binding protein